MQYLVLIYSAEGAQPADAERVGGMMVEYNDYTTMLRDNGHLLAGEALQPTSTATTVRVRDGQTITTDGPFAETKEALGGFYLIEAKDLDEALRLGGACPGAKWGSIEVRPIVDFAAGQVPA
ncbi:MAG TPA: YciI family protein [Candidatus Limnocylindrales bacterium]|nr:YciI family protein [Candidatus Limnocylindrales bacterium]